MQGRVCAYCGTALSAGVPGDVEHFRPKAKVQEDATHPGYWWLAYKYENYVLACRICNSSRKGNRFPLTGGTLRARLPTEALTAERPVLFHPAEEPVEDALTIEANDVLRVRAVGGQSARGNEVIALFYLGRADLARERLDARDVVVDALARGDMGAARRCASRFEPHSAVAVAILVASGHPLPTAAEEAAWLAGQLLRQLEVALDALHTASADDKERREAAVAEAAWAVAALWRDPPDGDVAATEARLIAAGVRDLVAPLREAL